MRREKQCIALGVFGLQPSDFALAIGAVRHKQNAPAGFDLPAGAL